MKRLLLLAAVLLSTLLPLVAQPLQPDRRERDAVTTRTVVPGARYEAGWFHRIFFGDHWRDLWTMPIDVEVLDLEHFEGGLTPVKKGGGFQTKSLRFQAGSGRYYKFRSLDKDPRTTLPPDLRETFAADVIQDQISSSNPYAPFVVAPLLDAVGVLNAHPRMVILPDDERLDSFRAEFAGMLGILEEHPTADPDADVAFAGAEKITDTHKLFDRLERESDEWIDAGAYLTARLMDIYLGDWDRHTDQWQWARVSENGVSLWKPIPRDRDQAFARLDGLFPWIATQAITQIESYDESYPKIADLTWSGRHIDRRFLVSLDRTAWDSVTDFVVSRLTDSTLESAVAQLPPNVEKIAGADLLRSMKSRRDLLKEASRDYYENLAEYVDVRARKKGDYASVTRLPDGSVDVDLFALEGDDIVRVANRYYHRRFQYDETDEVRLHMLTGHDSVVLRGSSDRSIPVRVIVRSHGDAIIDSSDVAGYFLGITPIPSSETMTFVHANAGSGSITEGPGTSVDRSPIPEPTDDGARFEPLVQDYGYDWRYAPWYGYSPDLGLFLGGGPILYRFGFGADPYLYRQELRGGYGSADVFKVDYRGDFRTRLHPQRYELYLFASSLEVVHFHGFGNENPIEEALLKDPEFHKVRQRQFVLRPSVAFPLAGKLELSLAAEGRFVDNDTNRADFISGTRPDGIEDRMTASVSAGLRFDTRNRPVLTTHGLLVDVHAKHTPAVIDNPEAFTTLGGEARFFLSAAIPTKPTLALRAGGEKIFGRHPFYESAFIGGDRSVRGYASERFAGDASLYGSAELRLALVRYMLVVPTTLGVNLFADAGRVYLAGEESKTVHSAYGGGLWFMFIDPSLTLGISAAQSPEKLAVYVKGGFAF